MGAALDGMVPILQVGILVLGLVYCVYLAWWRSSLAQGLMFLVFSAALAWLFGWFAQDGASPTADSLNDVREPSRTPAVTPSPAPSPVHTATPSPAPTSTTVPTTATESDPSAVPMIAAIAAIVLITAVLAIVLYFVWVAVVRPKARAAGAARAKAKAQAELEKTRRAERRAAMGRVFRSAVVLEDRVTSRWLAYEKDLELALRYPVMRDLRDPLVQAVVTAMTRARAARLEEIPELDVGQSPAEHPYVVAVHDLDVAMRAAEQEARRVRQGRFAPEERRALNRAEQLLAIAKNDGASPHERRLAYQRLINTLEGILDVPDAARTQLAISTGARRQVEAGV